MGTMNSDQYKSGFVAVMGRPNVGKSTLINTLVGQKIAAVSPRPQTTRKTQMGIMNLQEAQIIFLDTPGVHKSRNKLGEYMNQEALNTLSESDLVMVVVDGSTTPEAEDQLLSNELIGKMPSTPTVLAINKLDLIEPSLISQTRDGFESLFPQAEPVFVSALNGEGIDQLVELILSHLSEGNRFFPEDQLTDLFERDIAADLIRESALIHLRDEVPHGIAIRIDRFTERDETGAYIEATILVEKDSHKPIVIGQKGEMIKKIGTSARQEIEAVTGRKVYLHLRVKVRKNWRDDESIVKKLF